MAPLNYKPPDISGHFQAQDMSKCLMCANERKKPHLKIFFRSGDIHWSIFEYIDHMKHFISSKNYDVTYEDSKYRNTGNTFE